MEHRHSKRSLGCEAICSRWQIIIRLLLPLGIEMGAVTLYASCRNGRHCWVWWGFSDSYLHRHFLLCGPFAQTGGNGGLEMANCDTAAVYHRGPRSPKWKDLLGRSNSKHHLRWLLCQSHSVLGNRANIINKIVIKIPTHCRLPPQGTGYATITDKEAGTLNSSCSCPYGGREQMYSDR